MSSKKGKRELNKRYFVFYLTQICFVFFPIVTTIMLLFNLAEAQLTSGLQNAVLLDQMKLIGLLLCTVVPVSITVGWLFLRLWAMIAKPDMTPEESIRFIQRGLGI